MEVSITKISQNGQVVIPSEIRKDAGIKPATKFLVFNKSGNILLKQIKKESLARDMLLIEKSDQQIAKGNFTKADTSKSDNETDESLMR